MEQPELEQAFCILYLLGERRRGDSQLFGCACEMQVLGRSLGCDDWPPPFT
ncbi:hypothetical protein AB4Y40_36760 [Paraburkholderia sp. EG287B]|uniref:hypothetical protein n=1 Tax=Paraburkholderia sp. EG287B TaxID=3237010 RepID=UPI0034D38AEB